MSNHHKNDAYRKKMLHKINNDNIDAATMDATRKAKMRAARNRRLMAFFVIGVIVLGFLGKTIMDQNNRLEEKQIAKQNLEAELNEITDLQEQLKLQLAKLDDEEYIAKLARKELFLSEDGEIIFTMPNKSKKDQKDEDNEDE